MPRTVCGVSWTDHGSVLVQSQPVSITAGRIFGAQPPKVTTSTIPITRHIAFSLLPVAHRIARSIQRRLCLSRSLGIPARLDPRRQPGVKAEAVGEPAPYEQTREPAPHPWRAGRKAQQWQETGE